MSSKPLTEVLTRIHVNERYRLAPEHHVPWENMADVIRAAEMAGMHEVVSTLEMFGWELVSDGENISCRRQKKTPAQFTREHTDEIDPTLTQSEMAKPAPKGIFIGDTCGVCGQPSIIRESSCRTRCKSCGAIDGGCG